MAEVPMGRATTTILVCGCVATGLVAQGCNRADSDVRELAARLCVLSQVEQLNLRTLPEAVDPLSFASKEDVDAERGELTRSDAGDSALAQAMVGKMLLGVRAVADARGRASKCEVVSIDVVDDRATATINYSAPTLPEETALAKISSLADLPTEEARIKEAASWFSTSTPTPRELKLEFRKQDDGWRRFYDRKAAIEEVRRLEAAKAAAEGILDLVKEDRLKEAADRAREAQKEFPDDAVVKRAAEFAIEQAKNIIAGNWRLSESKDEMTDDRNVVVRLPSSNTLSAYGREKRASLIARCAEKSFDIYVAVGVGIDSDYGELYRASGRYRFGTEAAAGTSWGISDSRDSIFFRGARKWATTFGEKDGQELILEVPTYGSGRQIIKFDMTGAKTAVDRVTSACPGK